MMPLVVYLDGRCFLVGVVIQLRKPRECFRGFEGVSQLGSTPTVFGTLEPFSKLFCRVILSQIISLKSLV